MSDVQTYLKDYDAIAPTFTANAPSWLSDVRQAAKEDFSRLGFPKPKDEQWRFTRVRPLLQHQFQLQTEYRANGLNGDAIQAMTFNDSECLRLTFVNGNFASDLSNLKAVPAGVTVQPLREAIASGNKALQKQLSRYAATERNPFVALNTAHMLDGLFFHVSKGVKVEQPVHVVFVTSGTGAFVTHPRNLIVAERESKFTVVESYVGSSEQEYFTNAVSEVVVHENAHVDHYKVQGEGNKAYHFATITSHLEGNAQFETISISLGAALARNDVDTFLDGEGIECRLDGLYMASGAQHVDNHTHIDHAKPHCNSYELYKGILGDRARAVFNGKIHVHPDAQKTDAKQSNGCMLLSDDAQINTNPQLEIYADDVKCTHGAVVGQINDEAVFYLQARGIPKAQARQALIFAFANEVIERITVDNLRETLTGNLNRWLAQQATD